MLDLTGLNKGQYDAVTSRQKQILCLAGAGTGKTRVLTHRIARLFHEGVSCNNMLALTFTRLAGVEMKERVIGLIGELEGKKLFCNTFHAFCVEVLQNEAHLLGFDKDFSIYDQEDQEIAVKGILKDFNYKTMSLKSALEALKGSHQKGTKEDLLQKEYYFRLKQNNAIDFDSLIRFTILIFNKYANVKEEYHSRYPYIFIDEFQDTSDDQWELINCLQPDNIFVVGDDFQGIYGWRNANINIILNIACDPAYQTVKLEENYRSTVPIILAANTLIKKNRQTEKALRTSKDGPYIKISCHDNVEAELLEVRRGIRKLIEAGECEYRDVAVLARTNKQLEAADTVLSDIPHVIVNAVRDPMKAKDIKMIFNFIEATKNNGNDSLIKKIVNHPKATLSDKEILQIEKYQLELNLNFFYTLKALNKAERFFETYESVCKIVEQYENEPLTAFQKIIDNMKMMNICKINGWEQATKNLENAQAEICKWVTRQNALGEKVSINEMLNWVRLRDIQDKMADDKNEIKLMTVHASKGLEFEAVFVIGMNQGTFPSRGDVEEERRLFYVAITRAKTNLFISRAEKKLDWSGNEVLTEESRFIKEMQ